MKTKRTSQYANELVAVYLYRMRISRVRACTCIYVHPQSYAYVGLCAYFSCTRMYVYSIINSMVLKCLPLKDRADYTHTNNARYSNGSSLPVEGWYLSIIIMRVAAYFSHQ